MCPDSDGDAPGAPDAGSFVHGQLRALAAAFTFLTRLPLGGLITHGQADLARTAPYFPAVGLVVGAAGAVALGLGLRIWTPALAVIISVGATVLLTGAFHEDALADAFDGFGGGWDATQILGIMKDSRVGSYALVGVVLVLAAKTAALIAIVTALPPDRSTLARAIAVGRVLIAAHVLARWSSIPLIRYYPYVRAPSSGERPGVGRPFVGQLTGSQFVAGTLITAGIVAAALGTRAIAPSIACVAVTILAGQYCRRRIGGITGDALGATNQLTELAVYLVMAASAS
jgi:adenosylcobinamide-GDP ribazoletransferase